VKALSRLLLALSAAAAFLLRLRQRSPLTIQELRRRLDQGQGSSERGTLLLDVRTPADFVGDQGHIQGALNLPLEDLPARLMGPESPLGEDLERPIALICRTDRRSAKAAALLAHRGFSQVQVVQGGMTAWLAQGWPVENAHPQLPPTGVLP